MPRIDGVSWGKITVDGKKYHQALIIGDKVFERDKTKLEELFGTSHEIGDWEQKLLLSNRPEIILVASGFSGVLKISDDLRFKIYDLGIKLIIDLTPKIAAEYNRLTAVGSRVNALIHTTC